MLDRAEVGSPIFWMLVHDAGQGRSYTQLLNHYRAHPDALVRELSHHDPARVIGLARNLSLILWKHVVGQVLQELPGDDDEIVAIKNQLQQRV